MVAHFDDENRRAPIGFGMWVDLAEPGSRERSIFIVLCPKCTIQNSLYSLLVTVFCREGSDHVF